MTLTNTEVIILRNLAYNALVNNCTISSPGGATSDGAGYLTFSGISTTSPCRLVERTGDEIITAEQIQQFGSWLLWLPVTLSGIDPRATINVNANVYRIVWTPPLTTDDAYTKLGLELL